jgi:Acyltransferase family
VRPNLDDRPVGPRLGRLTGVEGLRAVAASSIVVFHVWKYSSPSGREVDLGYLSRFALPHLPTGVTLFFTLSGYLLYRPIAASLLATGQVPGVRSYLRNRALRILPAYWVVLTAVAVILPAALLRLSSSELALGRLADQPGILLSNALFLQNYIPASLETGIGPAWSLAVEVVFYLSLGQADTWRCSPPPPPCWPPEQPPGPPACGCCPTAKAPPPTTSSSAASSAMPTCSRREWRWRSCTPWSRPGSCGCRGAGRRSSPQR